MRLNCNLRYYCFVVVILMVSVVAASAGTYYGKLRVYVEEPLSRWDYDSGEDIHNGFLDFAIVQDLNIPDGSTAEYTTSWDASVNGFSGVSSSNIEIMAAAFNRDSVDTDAYDPYGYYFWAHYVDATAAAKPGVPGRNESDAEFTHTVLLEDGSATWCAGCPTVSGHLYNISQAGNHLFEYVTMVTDVSPQALARMGGDLNTPASPTVYADGGYLVTVGGSGDEDSWKTFIEQAGQRTVPDLDLIARIDHVGSDVFDIKVRLGNGVDANSPMTTPDPPSGDSQGSSGTPVQLQATHTDVEGDDLIYQFDFGDGETSPWTDSYSSGQVCEIEHTYDVDGQYDVKVRVQDDWGEESSWSGGFTVTIGGSCCALRGDVDHNSSGPDIGDLVYLVNYMFNGGPPPCDDGGGTYPEADVDGNGSGPDIGDLVYLVNYMFNGGPPPVSC